MGGSPRIESEHILTGGRFGSLRQMDVAQETMAMISTKESEIKDAITTTDQQLAEVSAKLGTLCLAKQGADETAEDQAGAISQVAVEQKALGESRTLLDDLLKGIQTAAADAQKDKAQVVNRFGSLGEGMQIGVNHGSIRRISFGGKKQD